jgi:hypothetical protein
MILSKARIGCLGLGALWALASVLPALADDTELFIGNTLSSQAQPNILFIVDNSGSMGSLVLSQDSYDAATVYPSAGCDPNRIYWRVGTGNPPGCGTNNYFDAAALRCQRAAQAFTTAGYYTDNMAQYDPNDVSGGRRWENISARMTAASTATASTGPTSTHAMARRECRATGEPPVKRSLGVRRRRTRSTRSIAAIT